MQYMNILVHPLEQWTDQIWEKEILPFQYNNDNTSQYMSQAPEAHMYLENMDQ